MASRRNLSLEIDPFNSSREKKFKKIVMKHKRVYYYFRTYCRKFLCNDFFAIFAIPPRLVLIITNTFKINS